MRILVAGWVGSTNLGDELLFAALRAKVESLGAAIVAPSVDPAATTKIHGVQAFPAFSPTELWRAAGTADAAILGGGSLVQDVTSPFSLPLHLSRIWAAQLQKIPFAGVGLGAGPLDSRLGQAMTRRSLAAAAAIAVRDAESATLLERLGLARPTVAADLALSLPPPTADAQDRLVVCLRPWAGGPRLLPVAMRRQVEETPEWFVAAAAATLDATARATGLAVHFVALQADRDGPLHDRVAARMATATTTATPDRHAVLDEIATGRAVVAMRYHGAVGAVLAGRPVVTIDYSPKVPSLARELGPGAASLAWSHEGLARLPAAVAAVSGHGTAVVEARERLKVREAGNDRVIARLFEEAQVKSPS